MDNTAERTMMNENLETLHLVREAGIGDKECMEKLLEVTRPRLFSYLLRLTMDYHLAEDLLQDVQTEILTNLWRLNNASHFWPWIYKHAWGKVKHHYRDTRRHKTIYLSDMEKDFFEKQLPAAPPPESSGGKEIDNEKLFQTIYGAMKKIGLRQRNVLTMRCFDEMSFCEIGEFLECSETNARVLFFRARNKLKSQLRRKGFRANRMLLPALGLFGALTSKTAAASTPVAAATTISGSSVEVGFGAAFLGFLTTKLGVLCSTVLSAALAWITLANLLIAAIITAILIPLILLSLFTFVFDD